MLVLTITPRVDFEFEDDYHQKLMQTFRAHGVNPDQVSADDIMVTRDEAGALSVHYKKVLSHPGSEDEKFPPSILCEHGPEPHVVTQRRSFTISDLSEVSR